MISKPKKPADKTAAYIRASNDQQMAASPARQRGECRKIAARFELPEIEDDGFYEETRGRSGLKMAGRDGLARMLVDCADGKIGSVIIAETSRLSRDEVLDQAALWKRIRDSGARLYTNIGEVQFDDLGSLIQMVVHAQQAHDESKNIAARGVSGKRAKLGLNGDQKPEYLLPITLGYVKVFKRNGEVLHVRRYHDSPGGYLKPKGVVCELQLTDDLEELDAVREAFRTLAAGGNSKRAAETFKKRGIRSYNGKPWRAKEIRQMVRRTQYVGSICLGKRNWGRFATLTDQPTMIEGICPPLIDRATWEAANQTLDVLAKHAGRKERDPKCLLAGLVFSPEGVPLYGIRHKGVKDYTNGTGRNEQRPKQPGEKTYSIRAHMLDNAVLNYLRKLTTDPVIMGEMRQQMAEQIRLAEAVGDPTAEELAAVREKIERAARRVVEMEDDGITLMVNQQIRELRSREAALIDRHRKTAEKTLQTKHVQEALDVVPSLLETPSPRLALILASWIEKIVVTSQGSGWAGWNAEVFFKDGGRVLLEDRDINSHLECHRLADWLEARGEARVAEIAEAMGIHYTAVSTGLKRAAKRGRPIERARWGVYKYGSDSKCERDVLSLVTRESQHVDQLLRTSALESSRTLATLTVLEMKRFIRRLPGGYFIRAVN